MLALKVLAAWLLSYAVFYAYARAIDRIYDQVKSRRGQ